jgi:hypothetical protein
LISDWLVGARKACEAALEVGSDTERLLKIAQVHALIAIAEEVGAIRELIIITEEGAADGDG